MSLVHAFVFGTLDRLGESSMTIPDILFALHCAVFFIYTNIPNLLSRSHRRAA
ncbi:hypothetical protein M378DRAFT_166936 [Amanita muscaria Koide BX008]|uniref:Uncharacterized protein n=1 Tax=Amanita muscaria (strain Koide BX008) TaxID=946122 RepID=A0A0C2WYK2_AMAMK|nr:hypothetical protein M378DRAFT_166936 [Amanita muscaria Koide BX008]